MLRLVNASLRRGPRLLLEGVDLRVHIGDKFGLTGANGCGKSSLFSLLRGDLHTDSGDLEMPPDWVIAHVAQETPALDRAALDYALDGDRELRAIEAELNAAGTAHDGDTIARLHARIDAADGYTAPTRAARLLAGLGFTPEAQQRPVSAFSGGWRMRLNLAQALMCRSDLLLLDEPTNHLDLDAVIWLEDWLKAYPGALLLISHDRDFLDRVVGHIAHIEQGRLTVYTGGYSDFERQRAERLAQQQSAFERQQREIARIERFVERFKAKASKARQAQSRVKTLERMERIAPAHIDSPFHFEFPDPGRLPDPLLALRDGRAGYGDTPILDRLKFSLRPGDRIGLLGRNGAGKSTLIKLLSGDLEPLGGELTLAQELRIGYFAQHTLETLRPDQSPLWHLRRLDPRAEEQKLRDYLGGFAFGGEQASAEVAPFSGGEKARLALALLIYHSPNLLLLDEPTNHLDLEMRMALGMALQNYQGALVLVSHDRHLLRLVCDDLWLVDSGRVAPFDGDLDDYRRWLADSARPENESAAANDQTGQPPNDNSAEARKARKREEAERRARLRPLANELKQIERELEATSARLAAIEHALADPDVYAAGNAGHLQKLLKEQGELRNRNLTIESRWLALSEQLQDTGQPD